MSEIIFNLRSTRLSGGEVLDLSKEDLFSPEWIKKVKQVDIAAAYYSMEFIDWFLSAFKKSARKGTSITLIFHKETGPKFFEQDEALHKLKKKYTERLKIQIYLTRPGRLFHTKMYRFILRGGQRKYLVGSANFSHQGFSQNEEVLVDFECDEGIESFDDYFDNIWENCDLSNVDQTNEETTPHGILDFYENAYLYNKVEMSLGSLAQQNVHLA